jgi:predicted heme/steroid binding protein
MKKILLLVSILLFTNSLLKAEDLTLAQLSKFDGKEGRKAYIAVDGTIYDVTKNNQWRNGEHIPTQGRLKAGIDATEVIKNSPHGTKVLKKLPTVGKVIK